MRYPLADLDRRQLIKECLHLRFRKAVKRKVLLFRACEVKSDFGQNHVGYKLENRHDR